MSEQDYDINIIISVPMNRTQNLAAEELIPKPQTEKHLTKKLEELSVSTP